MLRHLQWKKLINDKEDEANGAGFGKKTKLVFLNVILPPVSISINLLF
jgi:hypothetical protein